MCKNNNCGGHGGEKKGRRLPDAPLEKSLAFLYPEIAKEYRGSIELKKIFAKSVYMCTWECSKCGHKYETQVFNRANSKGCKKCAIERQRTAHPGNSLAEKYPAIAAEYTGSRDPFTIKPGTNENGSWRCSKCGNEWNAVISSRALNGRGCPKCGRIKAAKGRATASHATSMASTNPELLNEYLGKDDPRKINYGSHRKYPWRCQKCGNEWSAAVASRTLQKTGCPRCGKEKVASKQRFCAYKDSLFVNNKKLLREYRGEQDPRTVSAYSGIVFDWECSTCENKWRTSVSLRHGRKTGCPACASRRSGASKRICRYEDSIAYFRPDLLAQYHGEIDPKTIYKKSSTKHPWRCEVCDHVWLATPSDRVGRGDGCPCCARSVCVPGKNSMSVTHPHLALEYLGDAEKVLAGTNRKLKWKCLKCSKEWTASGGSRVCQKSGCPNCAKYGHNQTKPSFVYLICRPGQIQYGIMNAWTTRLQQHKRKGWELLDKIEATGWAARSLETIIRQSLKTKGIPTGHEAFRSEFDGSTEAFQEVDLSVRTIRELCDFLGINLEAFLAS